MPPQRYCTWTLAHVSLQAMCSTWWSIEMFFCSCWRNLMNQNSPGQRGAILNVETCKMGEGTCEPHKYSWFVMHLEWSKAKLCRRLQESGLCAVHAEMKFKNSWRDLQKWHLSPLPFLRGFLRDLIETTHLFLKMLEAFCKTNTHLVVQGKKRKKKKKTRQQTARENHGIEVLLTALWSLSATHLCG